MIYGFGDIAIGSIDSANTHGCGIRTASANLSRLGLLPPVAADDIKEFLDIIQPSYYIGFKV